MIFLRKGARKIVYEIKAQHQRNFADSIFVFANHLAALLQLQLIDIFLGRHIQIFFE